MNKIYIKNEIVKFRNKILNGEIINHFNKNIDNCEIVIDQTYIFNIDMISNEFIIMIDDVDLEKERTKMEILSSHINYCVIFNTNKIIDEILKSYSLDKNIEYIDNQTKNKILEQINLDFPRMDIHHNYKKCDSLYDFKKAIQKFILYTHDKLYTLYYLIIMLCTQATFYYPFSIIHDIYNLPEYDMHVLSLEDRPFINIIDEDSIVSIVFRKILKYQNISSQEIITKFHIFMIISIDITDKQNECNCQSITGILYWIKERNLLII